MIRKTRTIAQLAEYFPSIHEALDSVPAQHKLAFSWRILGESEIQGHLWLLSKLRPACNTDLVTKEVCKHSTKYIFFSFLRLDFVLYFRMVWDLLCIPGSPTSSSPVARFTGVHHHDWPKIVTSRGKNGAFPLDMLDGEHSLTCCCFHSLAVLVRVSVAGIG